LNIFTLDLTLSNFVTLSIEQQGRPATFLIDSGADISLFKQNDFLKQFPINSTNSCRIRGIGENTHNSLGTLEVPLHFNNFVINHSFQIVDQNFPIPSDAILGRDFLTKFSCKLDYSNWSLNLTFNNRNITIPILQSPEDDVIFIPPRCEVFRHINSLANLREDALVSNCEIHPGVHIGRSIVSKDYPIVRILNTTTENVKLKNIKLKTTSLSNFEIYKINEGQSDRIQQLALQLQTDNVPGYIKNDVTKLCNEFADIFALNKDFLTTNNFYKQKLTLTDHNPVYIKNYRIPQAHKAEINRQVTEMLANGIIEPSVSNYNSPILLVPKKHDDKKAWRLVVDFRQLNKKLIADKFPLARIDDILDQLGRAKWFSIIDLFSGFHQIPLDEESRDYTSFSTDAGSFRFTRLPFGASVAPNSFMRMMSIAFSGVTPEKAFLYMDDIIVIGCSEKHHLKNLRSVFETCRKYNLKLNPSKCNFFRKEVTFLGHKVTDKGILPDESKFNVVKNYPIPSNADEARRFVAFCNYYRRFIPFFSRIAQPLNQLTRKNSKFVWSSDCQTSFDTLKQALINPPILQYPDFSKQFILTTDASDLACGAVLSQNFDGIELPIAYASKSFTKGESHKATILKELTAIHWAIKHFRCYLYGNKFLVKSDHRPLVYLFSMKDPSSKLTRMRLDLEEFDFEIQYLKGKDNVGPDALSRISINDLTKLQENTAQLFVITRAKAKLLESNEGIARPKDADIPASEPKVYETLENFRVWKIPTLKFQLTDSTVNSVINFIISHNKKESSRCSLPVINGNFSLEKIMSQLNKMADESKVTKVKMYLNDEIFKRCTINQFKDAGQKLLKNVSIVLCTKPLLITNKTEKGRIIKKFHEDPLIGGHCGQKRLLKRLKSSYHWKGMSRDVARFVQQCHKCQTNKVIIRHVEPLVITDTPQSAFDIVSIDTIGPLPKSNQGNSYAITIQCELTKFIVLIPIANKEAETVAKAIFESFILIYGPMKEIRSDLGTEYVNKVLSNLLKLLHIDHKTSTPYHSATIGGCERSHRVFNEFVRMYTNQTHDDWDTWSKYYTFCYNTTPSVYHDYTPFELVFAKKVTLPDNFRKMHVDPLYNLDAYDQEIRFRLQVAQKRAHEFIESAKKQRKIKFDNKIAPLDLKIGDDVLITNEVRHKLDPWYDGPFKIVEILGPNCTIQKNKDKRITVHKNRLKKYTQSSITTAQQVNN
jgi:RNase H-like domain found in reverse transcriptase/Reverse transcriptase (RNA-dependent DNA polymerase)/Integrase zinc binding domain/Retroviral aspartyl protease